MGEQPGQGPERISGIEPVALELTDENIALLLERVEAEAVGREQTAAAADSRTDGGASTLRAEAKAFVAGREGTIPTSWGQLATQIAREKDPEYDEYMRLRSRFEGK